MSLWSTHCGPLHMWKYRITPDHFPSLVPLTRAEDTDLQLRKQPIFWGWGVFFFCLRSRPAAWFGLRRPTCHHHHHHQLPFYWKQRSVCFHCVVGFGGFGSVGGWLRVGGTSVYLGVGPLRCVRRKNCPGGTQWNGKDGQERERHHPGWGGGGCLHCIAFHLHAFLFFYGS